MNGIDIGTLCRNIGLDTTDFLTLRGDRYRVSHVDGNRMRFDSLDTTVDDVILTYEEIKRRFEAGEIELLFLVSWNTVQTAHRELEHLERIIDGDDRTNTPLAEAYWRIDDILGDDVTDAYSEGMISAMTYIETVANERNIDMDENADLRDEHFHDALDELATLLRA